MRLWAPPEADLGHGGTEATCSCRPRGSRPTETTSVRKHKVFFSLGWGTGTEQKPAGTRVGGGQVLSQEEPRRPELIKQTPTLYKSKGRQIYGQKHNFQTHNEPIRPIRLTTFSFVQAHIKPHQTPAHTHTHTIYRSLDYCIYNTFFPDFPLSPEPLSRVPQTQLQHCVNHTARPSRTQCHTQSETKTRLLRIEETTRALPPVN